METLERSRVCRLCGKHAGLVIDIFDKRGNHVKKINSVLPILVHEMDLLPKHICHPCNYKLQEFHKFYEDCLKTDANLKGQLSWMRGSVKREEIGVPMVQINNIMIKTEPLSYDEEDSTETILQTGNFTQFIQNNCSSYPERTIFPSLGSKCSHCGYFRKNGSHEPSEIATATLNTRTTCHNKETNNNDRYSSKDTIRKNLFSANVFPEKSRQIQTEMPVCNIPSGNTNAATNNKLEMSLRLERLSCGQNDVVKKLEMPELNKKMAPNRVRPRTTRTVCRTRATSSVESTNKPRDKPSSKSRIKKGDTDEANGFKAIEIKIEAIEEAERSLRPRMENIDYSYRKRKNPLARNSDRKRKRPPSVERSNPKHRQIDNSLAASVRNTSLVDSAIKIKTEPIDYSENLVADKRKGARASLSSKKKRESTISFEEFITNSIMDKISTSRSFDRTNSQLRGPKHFKEKPINVQRRRDLPENRGPYDSPYLRSQRGYLRSGKMMQLDSLVEKPKKRRGRKASHDVSLVKIKQEKCEISERRTQIFFKPRHCRICNGRFASIELYALHGCYANNKRH